MRHLGFLAAPMFGHLYVDKVWCEIAHGAKLASYHPGIKTLHTNSHDQTYKERAINGDHETYAKIVADGTIKGWIEKAKTLR